MSTETRRFVRSLGLDAYVVGGSVRDELLGIEHADEDFLVPGVDQAGLRAALEPHGRVEDLEVHGQLVGVRLHPRDGALRRLAPKGIEFTPPRAERSTGPRHKDFEIVSGPGITVEEDMARRDFTVNAMAIHLATGTLVDPFGGRADLEERVLRTVSVDSFSEDPLRILRGLRLVSQLGFRLAPETETQMRAEAGGLAHVSGERIGGGLRADGMGELSRLLLGRDPVTALRIARDTGALVAVVPEFGDVIGYDLRSDRQPLTLDEHLISVVGATARAEAALEVRLAGLLHDLAKPTTDGSGEDHAVAGGRVAHAILDRLRYPTVVRRRVCAIVNAHAFETDPWRGADDGGRETRRFLAHHGDVLARDLVLHKRCDLETKQIGEAERKALHRLERELDEQAASPHRIADLALTGADLLEHGFTEGPELGAALHRLLAHVVDDPARNERTTLLALIESERR